MSPLIDDDDDDLRDLVDVDDLLSSWIPEGVDWDDDDDEDDYDDDDDE